MSQLNRATSVVHTSAADSSSRCHSILVVSTGSGPIARRSVLPRPSQRGSFPVSIAKSEGIRGTAEHLCLWSDHARPTSNAHSRPGLLPLGEDSCSRLPGCSKVREAADHNLRDIGRLEKGHDFLKGFSRIHCASGDLEFPEAVSGLAQTFDLLFPRQGRPASLKSSGDFQGMSEPRHP